MRRKVTIERNKRGLTAREIEVLTLLSYGLTRKDIAERLCITDHTTRHHLSSIYEKLGIFSAAGAIGYALRTGIIE